MAADGVLGYGCWWVRSVASGKVRPGDRVKPPGGAWPGLGWGWGAGGAWPQAGYGAVATGRARPQTGMVPGRAMLSIGVGAPGRERLLAGVTAQDTTPIRGGPRYMSRHRWQDGGWLSQQPGLSTIPITSLPACGAEESEATQQEIVAPGPTAVITHSAKEPAH